jgi:hypothetical protein
MQKYISTMIVRNFIVTLRQDRRQPGYKRQGTSRVFFADPVATTASERPITSPRMTCALIRLQETGRHGRAVMSRYWWEKAYIMPCVFRLSANNAALQGTCMTCMGEERGSYLGQLPAMVTECFYWILPPLRQMSKHFLQIGYQH